MCGICGFIDFKSKSDVEILAKMASTLDHRGPDDSGAEVYLSEYASVGMGHSRLSILDLSAAGHQPMHYKRYSIVFNGEIYNFQEIRKDLQELGHIFKTNSDTEVILHAFSEWGPGSVNKFIGMFAFAILDKAQNKIFLFRDRAGVKPLYYYWKDGIFLFASELKSFSQHPAFEKKIDLGSFYQYMDFGYIAAPNCIYQNASKLNPGSYLIFNIKEARFDIFQYWNVKNFYRLPQLNISYKEAKDKLEDLLKSAYEYRMVSDVPVGVFLSGGYDSTSVAAILQSSRTDSKIRTFTIGFEEGNNEAPFAKQIAKHLGTEHSEYYCTTKEAQDIIPELPLIYDEPFADSSAIPTILISRYARKSVTVSLSADGGDEVFAGYSIYNTLLKRVSLINKVTVRLRETVGYLAALGVKSISDNYSTLSQKLTVIERVFSTKHGGLHQEIFKNFFLLEKKYRDGLFVQPYYSLPSEYDSDFSGFSDSLSMAQVIDYRMYMSDDILTKVDRATMSISLEGREPLLDHRITEFMAQLPSKYKIGSSQKLILKDIVHKYVPVSLMNRPKTGFSVPLNSWLRGDLKHLIDEHLSDNQIVAAGFFNPIFIKDLITKFEANKIKDPTLIWKIIQFQMWYRKWMQ